jgi:crossover junction endodeoxyribonuclease RusA
MSEVILDLPYPPSVNTIWRRSHGGMTLSPEYKRWLDAADSLIYMGGGTRKLGKIVGDFEAFLTLDKHHPRPGDLDNRIKATLDFAQRIEVITNDKFCQKLTVERGQAPEGCRLVLRSWDTKVAGSFVSVGSAASQVVDHLRGGLRA